MCVHHHWSILPVYHWLFRLLTICENVFPEGKSSQHNKNAVGTLGFVRHDKQQKEAHFGVSRKTGEMQQHSETH